MRFAHEIIAEDEEEEDNGIESTNQEIYYLGIVDITEVDFIEISAANQHR